MAFIPDYAKSREELLRGRSGLRLGMMRRKSSRIILTIQGGIHALFVERLRVAYYTFYVL